MSRESHILIASARSLMDRDDEDQRAFGADILRRVADSGGPAGAEAVAALAETLRRNGDPSGLRAPLDAASRLADPAPLLLELIALVPHPAVAIRWRVARALRPLAAGAAARLALLALASDARAVVRLESVEALAAAPPWPPAVAAAVAAACDDPDERVVDAALTALADTGAALPAGALARALAPERMAAAPDRIAESLLRALAASGRPEARPPLRHLGLLWRPRAPGVSRALVEACAA